MKVQFLSFLISLYSILCLKTPVFLVHKYYECFYLLNDLQNSWQVMLLCFAVAQVPFGQCNSLGRGWACTNGIFYVWYSEHRVALAESPLDHCFFSPLTSFGCSCLAHAVSHRNCSILKCSLLKYSFTSAEISS